MGTNVKRFLRDLSETQGDPPPPATLDLKREETRAIYRDLVKDAAVVIEASKPGTLVKYGLDPSGTGSAVVS